MLIDMLSASLAKSGALDDAWAKLDSGQDATVGVASSARPFLVAARFAADPRATLVVAAGEEAADTFATYGGCLRGRGACFAFARLRGQPRSRSMLRLQPRLHGRRLEALWSLQQGKPAVVVASARALLRRIAPAKEEVARPLALVAGSDLSEEPQRGLPVSRIWSIAWYLWATKTAESLMALVRLACRVVLSMCFPGILRIPYVSISLAMN